MAKPKKSSKDKKRRKKPPKAKRADKHVLYEQAVQAPDEDVKLLQRMYRHHFGRPARFLREDFCGTALLATKWVAAHGENRAVGVDLDPSTLRWGRAHNVSQLSLAQVKRLHLVEGNVLDRRSDRADVLAAFNFSYFIFKTRAELLGYFRAARSHLAREGLLVLDAYGGADAQRTQCEPRDVEDFVYEWDQHHFDPISHDVVNHIHFEFEDGSRIERAFTYEWRLWTLPEIRELLAEAGFRDVHVYWEGTEAKSNEPNGVFTRRRVAPDDPAWVSYITAVR